MTLKRPGKLEITDRAMELCNLPRGAKVLDLGCGDGTALEHLADKYGYQGSGLDLNLASIDQGKKRNSKLDLRLGDAEFLDDFPSYSFDCVMMECTLSLVNLADEALHEAYCVLKKGGKLFISDLYMKNPDPAQVEAIRIEAERQSKQPHDHGECSEDCADEHKNRFLNFRFEGAFIKEPLLNVLKETGFTVVAFEDRSADLDTYVMETIMEEGSLDSCITSTKGKKDIGYFMLVAEKANQE